MGDGLARRYGCTPYDVLHWDAEELSCNLSAYIEAAALNQQAYEVAQRSTQGTTIHGLWPITVMPLDVF